MAAPRRITPEEIDQINSAMEMCNGNRAAAARELEMPRQRLDNAVHKIPELRERWIGRRLPAKLPVTPDALDVHRPTIGLEDLALSHAINREEVGFRKGLEKIGVTGERLDFFCAIQDLHGRFYLRLLDMVGGGISKLFLDLLADVDKVRNLLDSPLPLDREAVLRRDRIALGNLLVLCYSKAVDAHERRAVVGKILADRSNPDRSRKPGFQPMIRGNNVQVNVGPALDINAKDDADPPPHEPTTGQTSS